LLASQECPVSTIGPDKENVDQIYIMQNYYYNQQPIIKLHFRIVGMKIRNKNKGTEKKNYMLSNLAKWML